MTLKKDFERILDVVTEGRQAAGIRHVPDEALACYQEHRPWIAGEGIQGLGIAERVTEGQRLSDLALKVYVDRKMPRAKLETPVPKRIALSGLSIEVETDIVEIGVVKLESLRGRFRPAMPGCGVSHPNVTVGTFGCLVRKLDDPNRFFILSNSHVLADQGLAKVNEPILQYAPADGGRFPVDKIGKLSDWVPFQFTSEGFPNLIDVAIAEVDPGDVTNVIHDIGIPQGVSRTVRRGMRVKKMGRTTGLTFGEVRDTNYRLPMWYKRRDEQGNVSRGRVGLRDQVLCSRFTQDGDSGSAILSSSNRVVGLHFAGSAASSIFHKVGNVLDGLGLDLVTEESF